MDEAFHRAGIIVEAVDVFRLRALRQSEDDFFAPVHHQHGEIVILFRGRFVFQAQARDLVPYRPLFTAAL